MTGRARAGRARDNDDETGSRTEAGCGNPWLEGSSGRDECGEEAGGDRWPEVRGQKVVHNRMSTVSAKRVIIRREGHSEPPGADGIVEFAVALGEG